eukprot:gene6821-8150_t
MLLVIINEPALATHEASINRFAYRHITSIAVSRAKRFVAGSSQTLQTLKPLGRRAVTCRAALGTSLGTSEAHSKLKGLEVLAGVDGAPVQLVEQWGPEDTVVVAWLRSFG